MTPARPQRAHLDGSPVTVTVAEAGLEIDGHVTSWLDVDEVDEGDHRVTLGLAGGGSLALSRLGSSHDDFLADLRRARRRLRIPATTIATGDPLVSFVSRDAAGTADVHVFPKALVVEPRRGPLVGVPLPLVDRVDRDGYTITVTCRGLAPVTVRALGAKTDEFLLRLANARRDLQAAVAAASAAASPDLAGYVMPDGWAVERRDAGSFWGALHALVAGDERAAEVAVLESLAGERLRIGLFTDGGTGSLPFVLASVGPRVAVESADDEARATYVFETADIDRLNAVLLLTSFRREALYLPDDSLGRWGVAVRTWPAVREARAALRARVVHDDAWETKVRTALTAH